MLRKSLALIVACVALAACSAAAADSHSCFYMTQFRTWKAADAKTMYIRVDPNRTYRLDLAGKCPALLWPDAHLVTTSRGTATVCSALDWDLKLSETPEGITMACTVRQMTELTPAEAAALPRKFRP